jgi:hypothetical protein
VNGDFVKRRAGEVIILLLGLAGTAIAGLVVEDRNLTAMFILLTLTLTAVTMSIKDEIAKQLGQDPLRTLVTQIDNDTWRQDARERVGLLEAELREWKDGRRDVPREHSIQYQIDALKRMRRTLDAIHLAVPKDKLTRWDGRSGHFAQFVETNRCLSSKITKRRILFLDEADRALVTCDVDGRRLLSDPVALRVCERFIDTGENGFGVDLRILWLGDLAKAESKPPPDLLVIDDKEAIIVTGIVETSGNESFDTEAIVHPTRVADYARRFTDYWNIATDVGHYLPTPTEPTPPSPPGPE